MRELERYRQPSYRQTSVVNRRWIGIGTKNKDHEGALPRDPSGNRCFVGVEVPDEWTPERVRSSLDEHREQLWAEAKTAYKRGEQWWFPASYRGGTAPGEQEAHAG